MRRAGDPGSVRGDVRVAAVDGGTGFLSADLWRVRMVAERSGTFFRVHMTAGDIYTVAGGGSGGLGGGGPGTKATSSCVDGLAARGVL